MANQPCTFNGVYDSLSFCKGQPILPGIRNKLLFVPKSDITAWPKLPALSGTDAKKFAVLTGEFTLAADKEWHVIELVDNVGNLECETQGEIPAVTFLNKITVRHPLNSEDAAAFCRQANADDMVYIVITRDGKFRVLGNESFSTVTKLKQISGEGLSGDFGTQIEISVTDVCPAPFYTAKVNTDFGEMTPTNVTT